MKHAGNRAQRYFDEQHLMNQVGKATVTTTRDLGANGEYFKTEVVVEPDNRTFIINDLGENGLHIADIHVTDPNYSRTTPRSY